jgi:hypothetical protein
VQPVQLPAPGQPLDRGALSLGLILLTFAVVIEAPLALVLGVLCGSAGGLAGTAGVVLTAARPIIDMAAANRLVYGGPTTARTVRAASIIGVLHALVCGIVVASTGLGPFLVAALGVFPVALAILEWRRGISDHAAETPRGEASVIAAIALVLGLCALAPVAGNIGYLAADGSVEALFATGILVATLGIGGALLVRAGASRDVARGIRGVELFAGLLGTLFVLAATLVTAGVGIVSVFPLVIGLAILRLYRVTAERASAQPDPELGRGAARLTIAWLLLGQGLLLVTHPLVGDAGETLGLLALAGGWATGNVWLHALVGVLEIVVAVELLRGTRHARALAAAWAIAVVAVLAEGWLDTWHATHRAPFDDRAEQVGVMTAYTWLLLVLPAVTLFTLRRPYTPLTARARRRA